MMPCWQERFPQRKNLVIGICRFIDDSPFKSL
jgi:hypothetical protein